MKKQKNGNQKWETKMINQKNKRIELTLSNEEVELLNSICLRFNISKSRAISQALKVFAAKRKHIITLSYKETTKEVDEKKSHDTKMTPEEIEDWKKTLKDLGNSDEEIEEALKSKGLI